IVEDISPEYTYETCNVTHPSMLINVTADWKGEEMCDHRKTALFTCTKKDYQRTILLIEALHSGKASAKLILPNDENRTLSLQRTISVDAKNLNLRIRYSDNKDEESEDLQLKGKIINKNYHVWSLRIHLDTFTRVKSLLANSFGSIINSLVSLARDPDHSVNKWAHSSIHMTLSDYFRHLRDQGNDLMRASWTSLKDSLESLKPFFETPLTLVWNIASIGTMKEYHTREEESAPGWISHYFDLAVGFFKPETNIIETVLKKFLLDNKEFRWEFITGRVLKMESFREWPSLVFELNHFTDKNQEGDRNDLPSPELYKAVAAFGRRSVLTFDGREYEMEEFATECIFLLVRDLCTPSFTVLGGKKNIQILLPDVTVRINDDNKEVVVKRHETAVEVRSPFLKVFCRTGDFLCTLQLRSTKIMGLLSATDEGFSLHEKDIASKRMRSYEVSGRTECENLRFRSIHPDLNEVEASYSRPLSHFARAFPKQFPDVCEYESKGGTDSHFTSEDFPPYSLRNEKSSMCNRDVWIDFRTKTRKCSSVRRSWWRTADECL
ncbi:apolipoprotein B-100, partial [Trichonephila inaurata madagascariensis]